VRAALQKTIRKGDHWIAGTIADWSTRSAKGGAPRQSPPTSRLSARMINWAVSLSSTEDVPQGAFKRMTGPPTLGSPARATGMEARLLPTGTDFRKGDAKVMAADKAGDPQGRLAQSGTVTD